MTKQLCKIGLAIACCFAGFWAAAQSNYGFERLQYAPFSELRWEGEQPIISHEGEWLELLAINGIPVDTIVTMTKREDHEDWREQFGLNVPWLLLKFLIKDINYCDLSVRVPGEKRQFVLEEVELTQENWYALAWYNYVKTKRVDRKHSNVVPDSLKWLTHRQFPLEYMADIRAQTSSSISMDGYKNAIEQFKLFEKYGADQVGPYLPKWLSAEEAKQDLDQLEWLIEHRYSYTQRKNVDYRTALDVVRAGLGDGITRPDFGLQVQRVLGLFGDLHLRVRHSRSQLNWYNRDQHLPFIVDEYQGRLIAIKGDRSGLYDEAHPFIHSIAGIPIESWRRANRELTSAGVPQMLRSMELYWWERFDMVLNRMEITADSFEVQLTDEAAKSFVAVEADMTTYYDLEEPEDRERRVFTKADIGYLPIKRMRDSDKFLGSIQGFVESCEDRNGLIIDLRGNVGGRRDAMLRLLPFWMPQDGPPEVINIRCFRIDSTSNPGLNESIVDDVPWQPESWNGWTDADRAAIAKARASFKPEMDIGSDRFAEVCYLLAQPASQMEDADDYFRFDKPLVILMDSWCYSATDLFLAAFKGREGVTLVGTPSMGGSGRATRTVLQNSQLHMRLPTMASFRPDGRLYDGRGVQPDVLIEPTISDLIGTTDTALDKAIEIIKKAN